ncbi:unnamed protein product, partial [Rotaria sordida]
GNFNSSNETTQATHCLLHKMLQLERCGAFILQYYQNIELQHLLVVLCGRFDNCHHNRSPEFGFLTAMRQEVTRMHKGWSLDTVTIDNIVLRSYKDDIREAPNEGVYVYGLYLEGAGWNRKNIRLHESQNKVVYVQMPVIHIFAINPSVTNQTNGIVTSKKLRLNQISLRTKRNDQVSIAPYIYMCPLYKKPIRTDLHFITMLKLASNDIPEHWILRGVALLCDIK